MADSDDLPKKNVALATLVGGAKEGAIVAALNGALNVELQSFYSHPTDTPFLKKIFTIPDEFHFSGASLKQALALGAAIGLVFGATRSALGAIHYNRDMQRWADRQNAARQDSFSPGMVK